MSNVMSETCCEPCSWGEHAADEIEPGACDCCGAALDANGEEVSTF